jgi:hypothetical protein
MQQQNNKCAGCNEKLEENDLKEVDHIVEKKDGGPTILSNLQLLCISCHWKKTGNTPNSPHPVLYALYRHYKLYQVKAGAVERQIRAFTGTSKGKTKSPYITSDTIELLEGEMNLAKELEKIFKGKLKIEVRKTEEWKWMKKVPGLREVTASLLLGKVDIRKCDTVSSLWRYLGYYDPKGKRNPGKGRMFRSALYSGVGNYMMRKSGHYRQDYERYRKNFEDKNVKGAHGKAIHRATKLWLSHLWETWRKMEGLETGSPYAQQILDHDHYVCAKDRGWPV